MGHVGDSILAPTSPCLCMAHAHLSLGLMQFLTAVGDVQYRRSVSSTESPGRMRGCTFSLSLWCPAGPGWVACRYLAAHAAMEQHQEQLSTTSECSAALCLLQAALREVSARECDRSRGEKAGKQ